MSTYLVTGGAGFIGSHLADHLLAGGHRVLAARVRRACGSRSPIVHVPYAGAWDEGFEDMQRRVPDLRRIRALIGFAPSRSLDEIIAAVVAYERERFATSE